VLDFNASRSLATSGELSKYRYLHFATHGYLDTARAGFSAVVLSMFDREGKPQDGFLRTHDIYNLKLPAELVVLSACETGLGKEVTGEGLDGLPRAFMYAGARRVVVSLWNVNDKATAALMQQLYAGMLRGNKTPAAALRAAQLEMLRTRQWQSPYFWAPFVMQGEWN
jgi:CHAT domain-containing protein